VPSASSGCIKLLVQGRASAVRPFLLAVGASCAQPITKPLVTQTGVISWPTITAGLPSCPGQALAEGRCAFTPDHGRAVASHARRTAGALADMTSDVTVIRASVGRAAMSAGVDALAERAADPASSCEGYEFQLASTFLSVQAAFNHARMRSGRGVSIDRASASRSASSRMIFTMRSACRCFDGMDR
jgi:hypothetical protein